MGWGVFRFGRLGVASPNALMYVTCNAYGGSTVNPPSQSSSPRGRVDQHRRRLRASGLRPLQIWVPDVRNPVFFEEAHRQSQKVASSVQAADDQDFIDSFAELPDE